jgi:RNA polymerase sigma-70 factor (ECF subfamily)
MGSASNFGGITDRRRLLAAARRLLRTEADAEDAVQDAYLRAAGARPPSHPSMQGWLHTVVRNLAIDQLRRERLERAYLESRAPAELLEAADPELPEQMLAMRDECAAALGALLRRVSYEEAAIILLREVFEFDYSDIARAAGKTVAATRQLVHRTLARARDHTPARRAGGAADDDVYDDVDEYVTLFRQAIHSRNPAVLFALIASPTVAVHSPALPAACGEHGVPRTSCTLVHLHGRYAIVLALDGIVLCTVPVGSISEDAAASTVA